MSKKRQVKQNIDNRYQIQDIINKKLREMIDMNIFIKRETSTMVPNTFGVTCPNCRTKDNIYAETVQTRSGDEAADRICTCLTCGYHWKISGG